MCMASENCKLQERVDAIDNRVSRIEKDMANRFDAVTSAVNFTNTAVNQLAADFGSQMNEMRTKLIEERVAWGQWARTNLGKVILWACGLIAFACGMNKMPEIIKAIKEFGVN